MDAGVGELSLNLWFQGIELEHGDKPPRATKEDYPSVRDQSRVAAAEPDRLSLIGKVHG